MPVLASTTAGMHMMAGNDPMGLKAPAHCSVTRPDETPVTTPPARPKAKLPVTPEYRQSIVPIDIAIDAPMMTTFDERMPQRFRTKNAPKRTVADIVTVEDR